MPRTSAHPIGIAPIEPFEVWLGRELAYRYGGRDPVPDFLRRLAEKLAESQAEMGCANREASAKTRE